MHANQELKEYLIIKTMIVLVMMVDVWVVVVLLTSGNVDRGQ